MKKNTIVLIICCLIAISVILSLSILTSSLTTRINNLTDEDKQAESVIKYTKEIKGTVIENEEKFYKRERSSVFFVGGGEETVSNYFVKVKEKNNNITTVKVNEDQYLNYNKGNSIDVVIDKENNKIVYDLKNSKDKKKYDKYKK